MMAQDETGHPADSSSSSIANAINSKKASEKAKLNEMYLDLRLIEILINKLV